MPDLDGKVAFVTGAGSGLGREIALTFARTGARVAVNDLRAAAAAAVQEELAVLGAAVSCGPLVGDVSDSARVRGWFETLGQTTGGRLDVLVNNAGYGRPRDACAHAPADRGARGRRPGRDRPRRHAADVRRALDPHARRPPERHVLLHAPGARPAGA